MIKYIHKNICGLSLYVDLRYTSYPIYEFVMEIVNIDGRDYTICSFSKESQVLCHQLLFSSERLQELKADGAFFLRARNAYISDLKEEILEKKTGIDISSLFADD